MDINATKEIFKDASKTMFLNDADANAFDTGTTFGGYINPEYWDKRALKALESNLTIARHARIYDNILGQDGSSFKVTIMPNATAAADLTEGTDVGVTALGNGAQVTFTPSEKGLRYQVTDQQARRGFIPALGTVTDLIGTGMALKREADAISVVETNADVVYYADGVGASSSLGTANTLDYADLKEVIRQIKEKKVRNILELHVCPTGFDQLADEAKFDEVLSSGDQSLFRNGRIGTLYGTTIYENHELIPASGNERKAIVLGRDNEGFASFGIGRKKLPGIEVERSAKGRLFDVVGTEEYDMQPLRSEAMGVIYFHDGTA